MSKIIKVVQQNRNLIILHITVFIWGFTGILGGLITIPATQLVWYRVLIASVSILAWLVASKRNFKVSLNALIKLFVTGAVLGLHWILFFYSIKISTVSVTLISLSSITLFTSILEPLFSKKSTSKLELIIGLNIIIGILLIFKFESEHTLGIITGLMSALCASTFSVANSKLVKHIEPAVISFYELLSALCWISFYFAIDSHENIRSIPSMSDSIFLLILGVLCTAIAYVAGVKVMKELSAFRVALITNLEPIYGILLANIFFGRNEEMSAGFYIGTTIILGSILLFPYLKKRAKTK
jgi:drug/metabolite transporter (DMT)-like permease